MFEFALNGILHFILGITTGNGAAIFPPLPRKVVIIVPI